MNQHLSKEEMRIFLEMTIQKRLLQFIQVPLQSQSLPEPVLALALQAERRFEQLSRDYPGLPEKALRHFIVDQCKQCRSGFEQIVRDVCATAGDIFAEIIDREGDYSYISLN